MPNPTTTSPLAPSDPPATLLVLARRATLVVAAALLVVGCLSNPTPHPGVGDDNSPTTGFESDSDTRGEDDNDNVDGGPPAADVCDPHAGDTYGDAGIDACGGADIGDAHGGDVCGAANADAGVDACGGADVGAASSADEPDVGPSGHAETR